MQEKSIVGESIVEENFVEEKILENSIIVLNYNYKIENSCKVAIFDLDSTLLKFYSNKVERFQYLYPQIPGKLRKLHENGYKLIVVSNQSLIIQNNEVQKIKDKLNLFILDIKLPFLIFLSIAKDKFRKPCTGIFELLQKKYFDTKPKTIFYVGDAAGPRKGFYSAYSDIKFAYNCKIPFYTPEKYFLGKTENIKFPLFDVTKYTNLSFIPKKSKYIFVYGPKKYSGVTTFIRKHYNEYNINTTKSLDIKNVYVNCNNLELIKKAEKEATFYLLDYSDDIITWAKGFFYTSGRFCTKKFTPVRKSILEYLKDKIERVPFIYDESDFSEEEKKIARMQLC